MESYNKQKDSKGFINSGGMDAKYIFGQYNLIKFSIMKIKAHPGCETISMGSIPTITTALTKSPEIKFPG